MATKSKLETVFTGDDRPFNKVASRMRARVGKLKGAFKGMGGAMAMMGVGMGVRGTLAYADRIGKIATRLGISAEKVQELAHAADLSGSSMEQLQGILTRLTRRVGEALEKDTSAAAQALGELGLNAEELDKLPVDEKFLRVADAFAATGNSASGVASLMKLLDTEVRELIPLMLKGSGGMLELMGAAKKSSNESISSLEQLSDTLQTIKTGTFAYLSTILGGLVTAFKWVGRRMGLLFAGIQADFADMVKALPALFPKSVEEWAKGMKSGSETRRLGHLWIKLQEKEDEERLKPKKGGTALGFEDAASPAATAPAKAAAAISERTSNFFDPRRGGGFFSQAGRGGISPHATKSLAQKMRALAEKSFNETKITNELLRDALL